MVTAEGEVSDFCDVGGSLRLSQRPLQCLCDTQVAWNVTDRHTARGPRLS